MGDCPAMIAPMFKPFLTPPVAWLAVAALGTALLAVLSAPWGLDVPALNFIFKPLTTLLILAFAWPRGVGQPLARRWVLTGLLLSLCGDVALLWPQQGFLPGLVSFLLAHLAYLRAFTRGSGLRLAARPLPFVFYALLGAAILTGLWPGVPAPLRGPVLAYVLCLAAMAAQAAAVGSTTLAGPGTPNERARAAVLALGGALFLSSDALLASDRFAAPLPYASLWILGTYWAAQGCIAGWLAPRALAQVSSRRDS
jgi:uncharacterized membrane protein YhhN